MKPRIYAHRGASGNYPENTMTAFRAAHRQGADGLELDVQLTRDGEVVVIHDPQVGRTTDGTGWVQDYTCADLQQLDAGSWFHPRFRKARVPRLEAVLAFVRPTRLNIIIELKNFLVPHPELEERVIELIRSYQMQDRAVISSFHYNSLLKVKKLEPAIQTALLYVGRLEQPWEVAARYQADQLHAPVDAVTPLLVKRAREQGIAVVAWTVNSRQQIRRMAAIGVDGVITDYPLRARKVLRPSIS